MNLTVIEIEIDNLRIFQKFKIKKYVSIQLKNLIVIHWNSEYVQGLRIYELISHFI